MFCDEAGFTQRRTTSKFDAFSGVLCGRDAVPNFCRSFAALLLLGFFTTDDFVRAGPALPLLALVDGSHADLSGHLTCQLLINTPDPGYRFDFGVSTGDAFRQFVIHWCGKPGPGSKPLPLLALCNQHRPAGVLLEPLVADHVVYQRTRGTCHCASLLIAIASSKRSSPASSTISTDEWMFSSKYPWHPSRKLLAWVLRRRLATRMPATRDALSPLRTQCKELRRRHRQRAALIVITFVGGDDRHAGTATNFRQIIDGLVLTQAWTIARFRIDDRTAFDALQLDGQLV